MKIGILGGSFDPVHIGHLIIAQEAYFALGLDKVLFMPLNKSKGKSPVAGARERLKMTSLAIQGNSAFVLDSREVVRGGVTYSIDSVLELKKERPSDEFFFILGMDAFISLPAWKMPEKLIKLVKFALYNRDGFNSAGQGIKDVCVIDINGPVIDISSSMIRERISYGMPVRYFLPDNVLEYIYKKGLYGS